MALLPEASAPSPSQKFTAMPPVLTRLTWPVIAVWTLSVEPTGVRPRPSPWLVSAPV